jgi:hypothetical protein
MCIGCSEEESRAGALQGDQTNTNGPSQGSDLHASVFFHAQLIPVTCHTVLDGQGNLQLTK